VVWGVVAAAAAHLALTRLQDVVFAPTRTAVAGLSREGGLE
jgi:hypothetical protein